VANTESNPAHNEVRDFLFSMTGGGLKNCQNFQEKIFWKSSTYWIFKGGVWEKIHAKIGVKGGCFLPPPPMIFLKNQKRVAQKNSENFLENFFRKVVPKQYPF